jgi:hypothetical protein
VPWATHRWHLASFGGDVLCYTVASTEPPHAQDVCAVAPNSCPARPSPQPPHPRRPVRPQAAVAVGISLRTGYQGCPKCQLRANATEKGRRRVPTLASGAPPRERNDAVWAGFEVAGGLWVLRARSTRFSSRVFTRPRAQRSAESAVFYACRFDEQSEQETHVNADRAAKSDKRMLEGACPSSNSRCAAAHQHTATRCMSIRTNAHTLTGAPRHARARTRARVRARAPPCSSEHASLE